MSDAGPVFFSVSEAAASSSVGFAGVFDGESLDACSDFALVVAGVTAAFAAPETIVNSAAGKVTRTGWLHELALQIM